ncbi:hypothetical protein [Desulfogranum mediterraneum]|uniref:hypothetical protein n=1 Tax=Desulfogranum mediterraneum TaxID=160661 RepID=UPI00041C3552|nr:hypothetical protein [Desulfogranum mediterraneum]
MQQNLPIIRMKFGLGLTTFATILLELSMVRVFDVILNPSMGYMVVTAAMFALGLGGIYVYLLKSGEADLQRLLPLLSWAYGGAALALLPTLNLLPFDMNFGGSITVQLLSWAGLYAALIIPFFIGGIIISMVFSICSAESHGLYFFDLLGAGLGCLLLVPLIPLFGPGGMLFVIAAMLVAAGCCFSSLSMPRLLLAVPVIVGILAVPLLQESYLEFRGHGNKRGIDRWIKEGKRDYVRWDAVSKLDVFNAHPHAKYFALDGGQQASWLSAFNGDLDQYRQERAANPGGYYFGLNSLAHFFKQDSHAQVLILGAAVGGETKAALVFGADHVDAIELVGAMVDAAKGRYADYSGNIFNHPRVNYQVGEGRTFLRSSDQRYDIIQMFSNHTSSSIAQGSGALGAAYLQTAEAYIEYFQHLKEDGILSINRHIYPRMLTTAALAWERLGRGDFSRHVLVLERYSKDSLPTMLVKMSPWSRAEIERVHDYANREKTKRLQRAVAVRPSVKVLKGQPFQSAFISQLESLSEIPLLIGTYTQPGLASTLTLRLRTAGEERLVRLDGAGIGDNQDAVFILSPPLGGVKGEEIRLELSSDNPDPEQAFSVWLNEKGRPVLPAEIVGAVETYQIAFDPLQPEGNLLPARFLEQPFPEELAAQADYRLTPVTDDKPFFNMIRKNTRWLSVGASRFIDGGTVNVLNSQLLPFLSRDLISFFVVGLVSILFACLFVFIPLLASSAGKARWQGRGWYLLYFSCLGAGFIIIELMLIQLFTKLIGFPTHTFATVLFSLLFAAGIGSAASKRWRLDEPRRWPLIFVAILVVNILFLLSYQRLFAVLLQYDLWLRVGAAVLMMLPLGFFLGMPFPLGMYRLGQVEPRGIPWAWGMNGFFTVFGGFLSLLCAFFFGFRLALLFGLLIYMVAWLAFGRIAALSTQRWR